MREPPNNLKGTERYMKTRTLIATLGTALAATVASSGTAADRLVVAEEFTATWCTYCPSVAQALYNLQQDRPNDIIGLMVHGGDSYTTAWGNSRMSFYSVPGYPTVWIDGFTNIEGSYGSVSANYAQLESRLNTALAQSTDVSVTLQGQEISGSQYQISGELSVDASGSGKTIRVQLIQCYDANDWPESGEMQFNTVRQSASSFDVTLGAGDSHTWDHTFTLSGESLSNPHDVTYICIAQTPNSSASAPVYNTAIHHHGEVPPANVTVGPGGDYATIQDAISNVGSGSIISVMAGTYTGPLDFNGRSVNLVSLAGAESTIIDANDEGTAVTLMTDESATIDGFTITGGYASLGSAMRINGDPTITNCIIRDNVATSNYCVLTSGNPVFSNTLFCSNSPNNIAVTWTDGGGNEFDDTCPGTGEPCPGDADGDGVVGVNDVLDVIGNYGSSDGSGDANGDGVCDVNDVLTVVANFGSTC